MSLEIIKEEKGKQERRLILKASNYPNKGQSKQSNKPREFSARATYLPLLHNPINYGTPSLWRRNIR